ncbi:hypothetical protein [Colwellia piezophila]|uniref:hypothetical protein n=1 Tax=Colwellia piezophila TaxID=211668 RepID=UPI00037D6E75|nr:hypothetical protein [Colwellia piezophila]
MKYSLANLKPRNLHALLIPLAVALSACGGSSEEATPTQDDDNTSSLSISFDGNDAVFTSNDTVTISAVTPAGTSFAWSISDESIALTGSNSSSVSFTAPTVNENTTLTLTLTATNGDNSVTKDFAISIYRKISTITISGLVTDKVIANATLVIDVAGVKTETTANAQGEYTVEIDLVGADTESTIKVTALGAVGVDDAVEFVSILPSLSTLQDQAGSDNVLDESENFGVNITNVTTAEFVLVKEENNGTVPTSDAELSTAVAKIDENEKLVLAAVIKVIVDNDDYSLADGVTTLDLVSSTTDTAAYINNINTQDADLLANTINDITNDKDLYQQSSIVGTWAFTMDEAEVAITFTQDGHYIHMEYDPTLTDDPGCNSGYELGTYTWSESTGDFALTDIENIEDMNGCIGLHDEGNATGINSLTVNGDTLVIEGTEDNDGVEETFTVTFARVISASNPLIGGFYEGDFDGDFWLNVFISDTKVMELGHNDEDQGFSYGLYSYDSLTNLLVRDLALFDSMNTTFDVLGDVAKVEGDILIWKDAEYAGVMGRTQTATLDQPTLTREDIVGQYFDVGDYIDDNGSTMVFNADGTATISSDPTKAATWELAFGQLLISYPADPAGDAGDVNELDILTATSITAESIVFHTSYFALVSSNDDSEEGLYEFGTMTWEHIVNSSDPAGTEFTANLRDFSEPAIEETVTLTRGVSFTQENIVGTYESIIDSDGAFLVTFVADGTGTIDFGLDDQNEPDINTTTWAIQADGSVKFTETGGDGEQWFWQVSNLEANAASNNQNALQIITTPEGQADSANYTVLGSFIKQ